jgi:ATP-dependent Clp protease ATP-binding subunit ClpC
METGGTARYADMFAALGSEPRLQIVRLLLSAHPDGMIVSDIQAQLEIPNSTLSHHLEKLRMEGLVKVRKDKQWLWYSANAEGLQDLLGFLYAECCTRSKVVEPVKITSVRARR